MIFDVTRVTNNSLIFFQMTPYCIIFLYSSNGVVPGRVQLGRVAAGLLAGRGGRRQLLQLPPAVLRARAAYIHRIF